MLLIVLLTVAAAATGLVVAFLRARWIGRQDPGEAILVRISGYVRTGAMAFLKRQYRVLAIFILLAGGALALANVLGASHVHGNAYRSPLVGLSFIIGAACSAAAGTIGMRVATIANVRTTHAARSGLDRALRVAFSGGMVMGLCVVGLGVAGLGILLVVYGHTHVVAEVFSGDSHDLNKVLTVLSGFALGASSIALFARIGGGIYTKAADVGADLVGKVEAGIPEDDPRNPAVIADLVGDNVGDVAGMGADLYESFVAAIIGAMVLGLGAIELSGTNRELALTVLPLAIAGAGILVSILASLLVRTREGGNPQTALTLGTSVAAALMIPVVFALAHYLVPQMITVSGRSGVTANGIAGATVVGLIAGVLVGLVTEYYCAKDRSPVSRIAAASEGGHATNIIAGLALGMQSTAVPVVLIAVTMLIAQYEAGQYGIAMAAVGMLCTTGIQLAVDAYGPIADNAGGLAQMAQLPAEVRERTDKLDAVGNTTAAIGKGFAVSSAALTAVAVFAAYREQTGMKVLDLTSPPVMAGLLVGAMLPYLFSSMALNAVSTAAQAMVAEVRRQFREIPGLLAGKPDVVADYARCVDISTSASIKRMILPGSMAVVVPTVVGIISVQMLGGLVAGVLASGLMLAISQANAGGAWDNAKKYIEDGKLGGKGSPAHHAAITGDTVGDPYKDTSGPSINILIKVVSLVSLVLAPLIS
jgi:K(+)-stimulated pyrophosphate-energized sodium pump